MDAASIKAALTAIAEGEPWRIEDNFIVVKNPDADEEGIALRGLNPNLVIEMVTEQQKDSESRVGSALQILSQYSQIDGGHHKAWVIDQVTRILAADQYGQLVKEYKDGEDGSETYGWDEGIAP